MMRQNMVSIFGFSAILAILVIVAQTADFLQSRLFIKIHNASYAQLFHQVFDKILHLKKEFFADQKNTEIINYLVLDVMQVTSITDSYIVMSVGYIFRIFSGIIGLFIISWKLALVVLAMIPIKYMIVRYLSSEREKNMSEDINTNREFSRWFGDTLEGIEEVHLWNLGGHRKEAFHRLLDRLLTVRRKGSVLDAWNVFAEMLLSWSVNIFLYILGGILICSGELTIGAVFAFISYSGYVTGPVAALINLKMYFARILPSAKRLFSFLDTEEEPDGTRGLPLLKKAPVLEFDQVEFAYEKDRKILDGVSFRVMPGEKAAIIGKNGSGKSTIFNLLLRFYEPQHGRITMNGIPIQEYEMDAYRALFSVVSQEPYLFMDSILGNVDLSGEKSREDIDRALKQSQASEYIRKFPQKERTQIGNNGTKLSGGEKQKLAVARALLKDAPIVILDEATSGFDVESDEYLHYIITHEMKDKTVLMITHHYHQLEGFDKILELRDGTLTQIDGIES